MAYLFTTTSGSTYVVDNGRLHRTAKDPILHAGDDGDLPSFRIRKVLVAPTVGRSAAFAVATQFGTFTTSPVVSIVRLGEKYSAFCSVNTVAEITPTKVVLVHPHLPDLHLPMADFVSFCVTDMLTPEVA